MNEDERNTVMKLVRDAYNEAFLEGMKESTSRRGGNPFDASRASRLLSNYLAMWIANESASPKRGQNLIAVFGPDGRDETMRSADEIRAEVARCNSEAMRSINYNANNRKELTLANDARIAAFEWVLFPSKPQEPTK